MEKSCWRGCRDIGPWFKILKPGITIGELNHSLLTFIKESGFKSQRPAFHGLGLSTETPLAGTSAAPRCQPDDSFRLMSGMVLEFEPHVVTADGKKNVTLGCPVLVTNTGCRSLNQNKIELKVIR
jgi:Xaa-Pro aminopeptidase